MASNPFDDAAASIMNHDAQSTAVQIRNNVQFAVGQSPDQAAQYQHLAKYVGVPVETVQAQPEAIKQQAALKAMDADKMVSDYPALSRYMVDPSNVAKSHDDIAPLAAVESAARAVPAAAAPSFTGPGMMALPDTKPTLRDRLVDWWAGVVGGPNAAQQRQAQGAAEANAILAARAADPSLRPPEGATQAQIDELNNRAWEQSRQAVGGMSQVPQLAAERFLGAASLGLMQPNVQTKPHSWQASTAGAAGSLAGFVAGPAKLAGAAVGVVPGAARLAPVAGEAWATGLAKSVVQQAATLGLASGLQETGGAVLDSHSAEEGAARVGHATASGAAVGGVFGAAGKLLPDNTIAQWLGRAVGVSAAQDAISGTNPLDDRPLEDKLFGYGMNVLFTAHGAGRTTGNWFTDHPDVRKGFEDANKAQAAVDGGASLQALGELASASKTRERDPEGFKEFVRSTTEDDQLHEVYVDANKFAEVLNQSGIDIKALGAKMPEVAAQFEQAVHLNGDIRIPVEDYATHIAGGKLDASLLPHLKVEADGMTYAQGQAHLENMQAEMKPLAEKLLAQKGEHDAAAAESQVVHDKVLDQLNANGRFRPEVNNAYAALSRDFYTTMAGRAGLTPSELYEKYPLKIASEAIGGDKGFHQGEDGPFGPVTAKFKGDAAGAIAHLKEQKTGDAIGALHHPEIGDIDLVWGKEGSNQHDGYGLAKLVRWHPEVVENLQSIIGSMEVVQKSENRAQLESAAHKGAVRLQWDGEAKTWLLTAFEKEGSGTDPRTDTTGTEAKGDSPSHASETSIVQDLDKFYQSKRGSFNPATNTLSLLKGADLSTYLHESGHFFLETMHDLARMPDAPEGIRADFDTLLTSFGEKGATPEERMADWSGKTLEQKRAAHEQFAESFEKYLMEGKAPTLELQGPFSRFRSWLVNIYKSLSNLQVELTPEVRQVMDRLLASDEAIRHAEQARSYLPLAKAPEGTTAEQFAAYQALGKDATDQAVTDMTARSMRDMKWASTAKGKAMKALQKEAATQRKAIREEVTKELESSPVRQAEAFMHQKENKGLDKDIVAEMFGFTDGTELKEATDAAGNLKDQIEGMTDQRMLERHGELIDGPSIERAAEAAIHNEARARFMATGLKMLSKSPIPARQLAEAAKQAADAAIAAKRVRDLRPAQHAAEEARANREAVKLAPKDPQGAVQAQRAALLNNRLFKAATDAVAEVQKGLTYLGKFDKPAVREKLALDYRDQIDTLLDRFDLRKSTTLTALDGRESLVQFVERMAAMGLEPQVPAKLLNEARTQHFKDMTVEEFRGLIDAVKSIDHLGRKAQLVVDGQEMREISALADEAATAMAELPQRAAESNRGLTRIDAGLLKLKSAGRSMQAALLKMEQMIDWLDDRNPNGVLNRVVFRRIADAGVHEADMQAKIKASIDELLHSNLADVTKDGNKIYTAPGLVDGLTGKPQRFTKKEMLALAGNMGNDSNMGKLLAGEKWSETAVRDFLDANMTKADWDFVAGLGRTLETLWPEKLAMSRRLGNTNPEKIAPRPFDTQHGRYEGWYWPMVYDPARAQDVAERGAKAGDSLFENIYTRANTDTGRMNTRNENYARPILLSLDVIPRVIKDEIHDIAYREAIMDADKFLSHPTVRDSITSALSPEHYDQLRPWLQSIANDRKVDMQALKWFDALAHGARTRATIVGLGYRLSTMLVHGSSAALESVAEVGPVWFGKGLADFANPRNWAANRDFVFERSGEMRNRMNEVDRDVREHLREIDLRLMDTTTSALARGTDLMKAHAYQGIAMLDMASALPTWMGAYHKGMAPEAQGGKGLSEQDAIYFADKTVRNAHGGTGIKDQAAVQRGPEFFKLFTMFYTFWNHNVNRLMDTSRMAMDGNTWRDSSKASTVIMRFLIYTLGIQTMHGLLHPKKDEEGGHNWFAWAAEEFAASAFAGIPILRDLSAHYITGKDYSATPAASMVDAVGASGVDAANALTGKEVHPKVLKHTITTAGYALGLPTGQAASTSQFLWDVTQGKQNPQDAADWWRGIVHGDMKKH